MTEQTGFELVETSFDIGEDGRPVFFAVIEDLSRHGQVPMRRYSVLRVGPGGSRLHVLDFYSQGAGTRKFFLKADELTVLRQPLPGQPLDDLPQFFTATTGTSRIFTAPADSVVLNHEGDQPNLELPLTKVHLWSVSMLEEAYGRFAALYMTEGFDVPADQTIAMLDAIRDASNMFGEPGDGPQTADMPAFIVAALSAELERYLTAKVTVGIAGGNAALRAAERIIPLVWLILVEAGCDVRRLTRKLAKAG